MIQKFPNIRLTALLIMGAVLGAGCDGGPAPAAKPPVQPPTAAIQPAATAPAAAPPPAAASGNVGLEVTLRKSDGSIVNARTDAGGKYIVADLPQGEYDLKYSSGEIGRVTHGGGRFEGQATMAAPAVGEKMSPKAK